MPSGLEIQQSLRAFVRQWRDYAASERGEAQTFLNQLFECYGTDRLGAGARFEDAHASVGIMDRYWPGVCIVEMKAPSRAAKLGEHRAQALGYWRESSDVERGIEAPTYVGHGSVVQPSVDHQVFPVGCRRPGPSGSLAAQRERGRERARRRGIRSGSSSRPPARDASFPGAANARRAFLAAAKRLAG